MSNDHYDLIVIGSGPGGATLAHRLAATGKKILILERGGFLPRETENWNANAVFVEGRYQAPDTWYTENGDKFHPGLHYYVGGNSKVYGAALFRLRERDFEAVAHADGMSPAWPLGYETFEPYYTEAERLFHVHGERGEDPTEPPTRVPYPHEAVAHEPRIQAINDSLRKQGLHPFHLPLGILLDQEDGRPTRASKCIRCDAFDGFPCVLDAKADAQVLCIDPMLAAHPNVTLLTHALVTRLETDQGGRRISAVHVDRHGQSECYSADIVVAACGALSTALLLLRSASSDHPNGLANGSDQVGRNYMRHNQSVLMALSREPNDAVFQKTLAVSDYYFGDAEWNLPMGLIQMMAKSHPDQIRAEALPSWLGWLPDMPFDVMAHHAIDFWLSSEDLPRPENRITIDRDGRVQLALTENNMEGHRRLRDKLKHLLGPMGAHPQMIDRKLYFGQDIPISGTAHQAGTARFGTDPASSVLDLNCKAHEVDNLYVADASFFVSIGAVNPTLTIIANAMRVADHLQERMG